MMILLWILHLTLWTIHYTPKHPPNLDSDGRVEEKRDGIRLDMSFLLTTDYLDYLDPLLDHLDYPRPPRPPRPPRLSLAKLGYRKDERDTRSIDRLDAAILRNKKGRTKGMTKRPTTKAQQGERKKTRTLPPPSFSSQSRFGRAAREKMMKNG